MCPASADRQSNVTSNERRGEVTTELCNVHFDAFHLRRGEDKVLRTITGKLDRISFCTTDKYINFVAFLASLYRSLNL
jgi:hypothetical protein